MSGRILIGLYAIFVVVGFNVVTSRAIKAHEIEGVSPTRWPLMRPAVSYLAIHTLLSGHLVREQDLKTPQVSHNLASSLPEKADLIGKYVVSTIAADSAVKADALSVVPRAPEVGAGRKLLMLPVDSTLANRINAGTRVWLVRGDTIVAETEIGHLICHATRCEALMLIDSVVVPRLILGGRIILPLNMRLPMVERLP